MHIHIMFMQIIFKKLGIKQNKWLLAFSYGGIYSALFMAILSLSSLYLKKKVTFFILLMGLFVWLMMAIVYFIKSELHFSRK